MATKIKTVSVTIARIVLGLTYFVFGLNFFLHFLPAPAQQHNDAAQAFLTGLFQSGYFFPMIKGIEVILGALLIVGLFVPLGLVILMPISVNILLFHTLLVPSGAPLALVIVAVHLYLAWAYRDYYKPLFLSKATAAL